jgi:hypothetical protein
MNRPVDAVTDLCPNGMKEATIGLPSTRRGNQPVRNPKRKSGELQARTRNTRAGTSITDERTITPVVEDCAATNWMRAGGSIRSDCSRVGDWLLRRSGRRAGFRERARCRARADLPAAGAYARYETQANDRRSSSGIQRPGGTGTQRPRLANIAFTGRIGVGRAEKELASISRHVELQVSCFRSDDGSDSVCRAPVVRSGKRWPSVSPAGPRRESDALICGAGGRPADFK